MGVSSYLSENYSTQKIDEEQRSYILKHPSFSDEKFSEQLGISIEKVKELRSNKEIRYNSFLNTYHGGLFARAIVLSKDSIFFGHGINNYRNVCDNNINLSNNLLYKKNLFKYYCSTHPHNIYLEILVETGLVGFTLFIIFIILFFKSLNFSSKSIIYKGLIISNLVLFFPFVTTGSFFSSGYFIYFFYFLIFLDIYKNNDNRF